MGTLGTHRTRSRWLPGADSLVGQHSPFGFSTCPDTWLPMPPEWAALTAENNALMPARPCRFSTCTQIT